MKKVLFLNFAIFMSFFMSINTFGETANDLINKRGDISNTMLAETTQDSAVDFSFEVDNYKYEGTVEEVERTIMDGNSSGTYILCQTETGNMSLIEQAANGCPVYHTPTVVVENWSCASNHRGWVRIEGNVSLDGEPLNAMVLANGGYMFSSGAKMRIGDFALTLPLDSSNSITLFAFCSGMLPYRKTFEIDPGTCQPSGSGCGQGLPLEISNLDFPTSVKQGYPYPGSVQYKGSFEDIANPLMVSAFQYPNGQIRFSAILESTYKGGGCSIIFKSPIPDDIYGTGDMGFFLIDYDESETFLYNCENNVVSNLVKQQVTIQR